MLPTCPVANVFVTGLIMDLKAIYNILIFLEFGIELYSTATVTDQCMPSFSLFLKIICNWFLVK